ncbi:MAG: MFS transporter [Candidatus Lokiarchaeota archaeon]|nr:MFS transporter [Candidatus Lokiarchaeota archaeon]
MKDSMAVKVPFKTKILYGMGLYGTQMFNGIQAAATAWFWLDIMLLNYNYYSFIMVIIYNIWNAINDPIAGWVSDRTRTNMGRRIPYIRFLTPVWLISTILLFFPYLTLNQITLAIWFTIMIVIFDGCYTFVAGCYNSLMPELTSDTQERTKINITAQVFGMVGVALSFIFPLLLEDNVNAFFIFVIIGSITALLVLFIPSFFLKERNIKQEKKPLGLVKAVVESVKNRAFMSFVGWNFMIQFTTSIMTANIIFYASNVLLAGMTESILLFVALFGTLLPGFFIYPYLSKKKGLRFSVLLGTLFLAVGLLLLFVSEIFIFSFISLLIAGMGLAGATIFSNVMIGESADFDELRTKRRREAMFFGANALFTKPAIGLAHGVLAWVLNLTGYDQGADPATQLPSAIFGIRMIMGLLPSIALFTSLIFIYFYPNKKDSEEMKRKLAVLHSEV